MIAVTLDAALVEDLLVHAGVELLGEGGMTRPADVGDASHTGRRGAMVAMTVVARRRGEIVPFRKRAVMDALLVVGELTGRQRRTVRQRVAFHVRRVGVTAGAGRRHMCRKHRRLRIADAPDPMRAVTAHACSNVGVAFRQQFAVHAGGIFSRLVDALARREPAHELAVAVTARTRRDYRRSTRLAPEAAAAIMGTALVGSR